MAGKGVYAKFPGVKPGHAKALSAAVSAVAGGTAAKLVAGPASASSASTRQPRVSKLYEMSGVNIGIPVKMTGRVADMVSSGQHTPAEITASMFRAKPQPGDTKSSRRFQVNNGHQVTHFSAKSMKVGDGHQVIVAATHSTPVPKMTAEQMRAGRLDGSDARAKQLLAHHERAKVSLERTRAAAKQRSDKAGALIFSKNPADRDKALGLERSSSAASRRASMMQAPTLRRADAANADMVWRHRSKEYQATKAADAATKEATRVAALPTPAAPKPRGPVRIKADGGGDRINASFSHGGRQYNVTQFKHGGTSPLVYRTDRFSQGEHIKPTGGKANLDLHARANRVIRASWNRMQATQSARVNKFPRIPDARPVAPKAPRSPKASPASATP